LCCSRVCAAANKAPAVNDIPEILFLGIFALPLLLHAIARSSF
jgi:hypothetical protein